MNRKPNGKPNGRRTKGILPSIRMIPEILATGRFFSLEEMRGYADKYRADLRDPGAYRRYVLAEGGILEDTGEDSDPRPFRIALHTHTRQSLADPHGSDGLASLPEMLAAAEAAKLDAIDVSNHGSRRSLAFEEDLDGMPFGTGLGWHAVEEAKKLGYDGRLVVLPGVEAEVQRGIHFVIMGSDYPDYSGLFRSNRYDRLLADWEKTGKSRESEVALHLEHVRQLERRGLDEVSEYLAEVPHVVTLVPHAGTIYAGAGPTRGWKADAREVAGNGEEAAFTIFIGQMGARYGATKEAVSGMGIIRYRELEEYKRRAARGGYLPAVVASPDAHTTGMVDLYLTEIDGLTREDFSDIPTGFMKMKRIFREDHAARAAGAPKIRAGILRKHLEPGAIEKITNEYFEHANDTILGRGQILVHGANALAKHYLGD